MADQSSPVVKTLRSTTSSGRVESRLLSRRQAANYCGTSVSTFLAHCPVLPISLGPGKRLERYDIHSLDRWIDSLGQSANAVGTDWLDRLEAENEADTTERT